MASQGSPTISLKVLIDKENKKVVMAEADSDFVDILLSFLTMPIGTIVRLISEQPQPSTLGSMTGLYKGVENLDEQLLQGYACKSMLLNPKNLSEISYRRLKLDIDDTKSKFYICADFYNCKPYYSAFKDVSCGRCGRRLDKETCLEKEDEAASPEDDRGVFVRGMTKFLVTDDLQVEPMSSAAILTVSHKLGLKDVSSFQETTLSICSKEEILNLLKGLLFSKTPLTDVFLLGKQEFTSEGIKSEIGDAVLLQAKSLHPVNMSMRLMISKSMNKVLYAEAEEDVVNFLLSFLTLPLGSILQLLGMNSSLGSMDNLYRSVECSKILKAASLRDQLINPSLCRGSYNPLGVHETDPPNPLYVIEKTPNNAYLMKNQPKSNIGQVCCLSSSSGRAGRGGFLKGPATFMITDNLVCTPLVSMWNLSFFKNMKVPVDDMEVLLVDVDKEQALKLLKASLFSKSVLTDVFINLSTKRPKREPEN